jgi:uncharacterized repeat protein (TIGR01451 family)
MEPAIRDGEFLWVEPCLPGGLRKGDVVLFSDGATFRAHRLIVADAERDLFITRGDAGSGNDEALCARQLLGKVVAKQRTEQPMRAVRLEGMRWQARLFAGRVGRRSRWVARNIAGDRAVQILKALVPRLSHLSLSIGLLLLLALVAPSVSSAQVVLDSASSAGAEVTGATPTVSFTHTTSATANRVLVVGVSINLVNSSSAAVNSVTYNGNAPLTFWGAHNDAGNTRRVEMWYLINPANGTDTVSVVLNPLGAATVGVVAGAITFTGADQTSPLRPFVFADGAAAAYSSLNVSSALNEMVVDTLAIEGDETISAFGPTQISEWNQDSAGTGNATTDVRGTGSIRSGAPSVPLSETFSANSNWSEGAVSVRPLEADLAVTVSSSAVFFPANVSYTISVTNNGPSAATTATLTDTVAAGLSSIVATPSQGSCSGTAPITCTLGALAVGGTATVTVTATPAATGGYMNSASVTGTPVDLIQGNNNATGVAFVQSNACGNPANNGAGGTLTLIINTYYPGTASVAVGATSIPVGASTGSATAIGTGDLLLVIQMQDAAINSSNSSSYGDGSSGSGSTNLNNVGNFEFVTANGPVSANKVSVTGAGPGGGLLYGYNSAVATAAQGQRTYQVVRVPQYSSATLSSGLTALAWNGSTGGILALDVAGTLTLGSAVVSVNGLGFRGGAGLQLTGKAGGSNTDYRQTAPAAYTGNAVAGFDGAKGEGIAGTPRWVNSGAAPYYLNTGVEGYPNGSMARGAPGNAGGGGTDADPAANDQNAGGGGGANGGAGGFGGDAWNSNLSVGGLGGSQFYATEARLVMGAGGGAGTRNNSNGDNQASNASAGGGIVILRAESMTGTATITANGLNAYNGTANDAGGGGGAAGSIVIVSGAGGESGLTVSAQGGNGGNAWASQAFTLANRHGPGGGGGGGAVFISAAPASLNVSGGSNGTTLNPGVSYGATPGVAGISATNATLPQMPGLRSGAECTPDLTVAKSHVGSFTRGSTGNYTVTVSNISLDAATSGLVTATDTVPSGLTPTAASGTGWSCVVSAPTVTCTRSDALSANSSYPAISITVSVAQGAANTVVNSVTVSGGGELNLLNDTATDSTNIVSSADMAIVKTAVPNPVAEGSTLTYTLTVTNNGPTDATNVTTVDGLPSAVSFISAVPSQGSCSLSGVTVTCLLGTMNSGAVATVTIAVTAVTPSDVTNTATVSADQPDPNSANNTSSVTVLITYPTQITLEKFVAVSSGGQVLLSWKTGWELKNLGFNIYREENGQRVRLNPSLIAGSALIMRGGLPKHRARSYAWIDRSQGEAKPQYWLEDVETDGTRSLHGPVSAQAGMTPAGEADSELLSGVNSSGASSGLSDTSASHVVEASVVPAAGAQQRERQFQIAAHPAVRIEVQREGWYRVTQPQLVAAGLNPSVDPTFLGMFVEGNEIAIAVTGATQGSGGFGAHAAIEFYGAGIDTPYTDKRVYWLVTEDRPGKRIGQWNGSGEGGQQPQVFPATVILAQRTTYFAALLKKDTDNFFGALVSTSPVEQILNVSNPGSAPTGNARLQVALQGVIDGALHDVSVSLNGATLGEVVFTGQHEGISAFPLPTNLLREGANVVTLTAQDGENDTSLVNYIRLTYPRTYTAQADALMFTANAEDHVVVTGFTNPPTRLVDITDPSNPLELKTEAQLVNGSYQLELKVPWFVSGRHALLAVADDRLATPFGIARNHPSNWHAVQPGGTAVMISGGDFVDQLAPLVQLRQAQGISPALVQVDDLFNEFNFGERSPWAIREFLRTATANWQNKPQYLLLVGDASLDPRDYLGLGFYDFVPTRIIITSELKTASDDWFSDLDDSGFAQIPTGRLPVRTQTDAANVVAKIVGYEGGQTGGGWTNGALMIADVNDPTLSFTQEAQSVQALLPRTMNITDVFATGMSQETAQQDIVNGINSGQLLVNYDGHGSEQMWSGEDLMDDTVASTLTNGPRLPLILSMACLTGFFQDVYYESLAEALLLSTNGGAVAVWATSGLLSGEPQLLMNQTLVKSLFTQPAPTLGDAIAYTKSSTVDVDARHTYILFGDPLMRLKPSTGTTMQKQQGATQLPELRP